MDIETFRDYCLSFPQTHEGTPFDGFFRNARSILVMYVAGKMFCFFDMDKFDACTIKCNPDKIAELKEKHKAISEPFNLSPKYWISIHLNDDVPDKLLRELVRESYDLVVEGLTKKERQQIESESR